ncbi:MAG TPA: aromatic amino acid transport family protein [Bellilinea sp.]|nr:aromatic amino acid transport family protein [Bellilinea sp.]
MREHELSQWEAISLMVGAGVGAGIMAVPYLAQTVGLAGIAVILPIAWLASVLVHLMLAEVLFRTGKDLQVIELMRIYVLKGKGGQVLLWLVFALLSVAFLANLAAYVSGAGEILAQLTGLNLRAAEIVIYILSAGVVFFGLKAVGIAERYGTLVLFALIAALVLGSMGVPLQKIPILGGGSAQWLAVYSMIMYALWTFYSVPQVVKGTHADPLKAVRAIKIGLGINGALTFIVALVAFAVSDPVTELAILGISDKLGPWAGTVGSLFIMAALVTSYWSVSLALADILRERTGISVNGAWLLATLPSLLLLWLGIWRFMEYLRLAAGATALVVALITIPMYLRARKDSPVADPVWTLGSWGRGWVLALVTLALILMAYGSLAAV